MVAKIEKEKINLAWGGTDPPASDDRIEIWPARILSESPEP